MNGVVLMSFMLAGRCVVRDRHFTCNFVSRRFRQAALGRSVLCGAFGAITTAAATTATATTAAFTGFAIAARGLLFLTRQFCCVGCHAFGILRNRLVARRTLLLTVATTFTRRTRLTRLARRARFTRLVVARTLATLLAVALAALSLGTRLIAITALVATTVAAR